MSTAGQEAVEKAAESGEPWGRFYRGVLLGFEEVSLPREMKLMLQPGQLHEAPPDLTSSFQAARKGAGRLSDPLAAAELLNEASEAGFGPASFALAVMYAADSYELWDDETEVAEQRRYLRLAHEQGFAMGTAVLGEAYARGHWGYGRDAARGRRLLMEARERDSAYASWMLGTAYFEGWFGPVNKDEARRYLEEAGDRGLAVGYGDLGVLFREEGEYAESIRAFEKGLVLGSAEVQLQLGRHLFDLYPVEYQDFPRAKALLTDLTKELSPQTGSAAIVLSMIARADQETDEQLRWLQLAADHGRSESAYSDMAWVHVDRAKMATYGELSEEYRWTDLDADHLKEAFACFRKSADAGNAWSMFRVGDLMMLGYFEGYEFDDPGWALALSPQQIHTRGTSHDQALLIEAASLVCRARSIALYNGDSELTRMCDRFLARWGMVCP